MGLLDLTRLMSQAPLARDGLIATSRAANNKRKGSPCQRDGDSQPQGGEIGDMYSGPSLPEDVWCHIHSLMPMRDAARASCVSHAFLCSWRRHPNLTFDIKTLGLDKSTSGNNEIARYFSSKVDQILEKHSGIGVKRLNIEPEDYNVEDSCHLNRWLQIAVTPGIEELTLWLPSKSEYNFPNSLLCDGLGDSIRSIRLASCSFSPSAEPGWLRSLTRLHLCDVWITDDELGRLLSNSFALERLEIWRCDMIVCLKVPCLLQWLSYVELSCCDSLETVDIEAPNVSSLYISGDCEVQISLGEKLQMKDLDMDIDGALHYACVELPSSVPNLETLTVHSCSEVAKTPMLHSKFLHLKKLWIDLGPPFSLFYDYFSLVTFLDGCPSLEAFVLDVSQRHRQHVSIFTDDSDLRQIQEHRHHKMKRVEIIGFSCVKSLVELTCHIVESIMSLEYLILDASQCFQKCSRPENKSGECSPVPTVDFMEGHQAVLAIRKYIEPKVPSTVMLDVVEPCSKCHDVVALDV